MRFPTESERTRRAKLIELLDRGLVEVHLDARREGVDVPEHLRDNPMLVLNLSRRFGLEVLELGPLVIKASLGFGTERYLCVMPWNAIWAFISKVDDEQVVFPDAVPNELLAAAQQAFAEMPAEDQAALRADAAALQHADGALTVAEPGDAAPEPASTEDAPSTGPTVDPQAETKVPFLRIVK